MITLACVSKSFPSPAGRRLLISRASACFAPGSRTAIIGAAGSGKSVVARLIGRTLRPDSGMVTGPRPAVPVLGYSAGINPFLSGRQNVSLLADLAGTDRSIACAFVSEFAALDGLFGDPVRTYTPAQRARLAFAFSYALRSPLLIADEQLSTGDAGFREGCEAVLDDRIAGGAIFVLLTGNPGLAARHCTRFMALAGGRLLACADAAEASEVASADGQDLQGQSIHA